MDFAVVFSVRVEPELLPMAIALLYEYKGVCRQLPDNLDSGLFIRFNGQPNDA